MLRRREREPKIGEKIKIRRRRPGSANDGQYVASSIPLVPGDIHIVTRVESNYVITNKRDGGVWDDNWEFFESSHMPEWF